LEERKRKNPGRKRPGFFPFQLPLGCATLPIQVFVLVICLAALLLAGLISLAGLSLLSLLTCLAALLAYLSTLLAILLRIVLHFKDSSLARNVANPVK
jgi:hypothetical protein